jgi:hypothetical protein
MLDQEHPPTPPPPPVPVAAATPTTATTSSAPTNPIHVVRDLLGAPLQPLERAMRGDRSGGRALVVGGLITTIIYGFAAGTFQGGLSVAEAGLKGALVVIITLLLCAPSLWVFSTLAGVRWTANTLGTVLASVAGLAGLVLLGLLPVAWLFSASSRFLGFVTVVHVVCWSIALGFAGSYLKRALSLLGGRAGAGLWTVLALVVSLQVATVLRPLLWREPTAPVFTAEKLFFLEHFLEAAEKHQPKGDGQ